jgi:sigma-B regulation protein RsbU (phosphoserine phosphatase)
MSELKSAIAVPLFDEGKVLGILYADTSNPMHRYNDEYLRVMATFGNILASRLLNYELLNEREEKRVIDREIKRASAIQKALLATSVPQIPGYAVHAFQEPSRSVGGDLYDVRQLPNGRLLLLVADVSGKGMGAALLMSNILASFRILYDTESFDICKAVERVSVQLHKYSAPADFATLFMATVEPSTGKLCYINAGHNPPLIARKNGNKEFLEPCGIMIGAFDFANWEPRTVQFDEDDLLLVFSDGVTEADRGDEQYGEQRMEDLVVNARDKSPREIASLLMDDINNFIGDAPRSDDITLLLLKRERS